MNAQQLVISFFERVYYQKEFDYVMEIFTDDYFEHTGTGARSNADALEQLRDDSAALRH